MLIAAREQTTPRAAARPVAAAAIAHELARLYGPIADQTLPGTFGGSLGRLYFAYSGFIPLGSLSADDVIPDTLKLPLGGAEHDRL
jgi:hypothetical protein